MNPTDNKRTTEREREKTYTNQPATVTATPRRLNEVVLQEVKLAISDIEQVVFDFGCVVVNGVPTKSYLTALSKRTFQ